jgi:penicillin-binding protein 2
VDVRNGEVLVAASAPVFDPNLFVNGISHKNYQKLITSKDKPLFNRVVKGVYPPGSTIKPFIAIAALEEKEISISKKKFCRGYYQLPNHKHKFRDWKRLGHGFLDVKGAIAESCDVYFYSISHKLGIKNIHKYLDYFGFGKKTGIDIPGELSGVLPSKLWKKNNKNLPWYLGETIITGIGQGFLTTTPLQLAVGTAAISNNGIVFKPSLVKEIRDKDNNITTLEEKEFQPIAIKKIENWKAVIAGMRRTVYGIHGTARRLNRKRLKYTLAGKTGTAQVFGLDVEEEYIASKLDKSLRDHALFTGFAPIQNTEVAIAVIVENAGSGSSKAAPLAKKVLDAYFKNKL